MSSVLREHALAAANDITAHGRGSAGAASQYATRETIMSKFTSAHNKQGNPLIETGSHTHKTNSIQNDTRQPNSPLTNLHRDALHVTGSYQADSDPARSHQTTIRHAERPARPDTHEHTATHGPNTTTPAHATAAPLTAAPSTAAPFYLPISNEVEIFQHCHAQGMAVMLKGPTGCGKTRFVEYMAHQLGRPLITIACHDDLSASDLIGRFLISEGATVWQDGPLTRAVRTGAICYLDEVVEARQDTTVVLHPLTDYRRILPIDKTGETLVAAPGFQLVISYNPGYQRMLKDLKPSTRQRFVALDFDFPGVEQEAQIVVQESGIQYAMAHELVTLGRRLRGLQDHGLAEVPSTRILVATARLIAAGIEPRAACHAGLISPLSDDPVLIAAMRDLADASFV